MYGADYVKIVGAFLTEDIVCLDCLKKTILELQPEAVIETSNDLHAWLLQWQIKGNDCQSILAYQQEEWEDGLWCDQCGVTIFEPVEEE